MGAREINGAIRVRYMGAISTKLKANWKATLLVASEPVSGIFGFLPLDSGPDRH